jgi:hypothetical protein
MFRAVIALCAAALLSGCAASDKLFDVIQEPMHNVFSKLPDWAGGPPEALPPRPTDPRYAAYRDKIEGKNVETSTADQAKVGPLH